MIRKIGEDRALLTILLLTSILCFSVNQPPVFTTIPDHMDVLEGEEVSVSCEVRGKPIPKVTWYKDGKVVKQAGKTRLQNIENRENLTCASTISTKEVDVKRHDGKYLIEAKNIAGTAEHEICINGEQIHI